MWIVICIEGDMYLVSCLWLCVFSDGLHHMTVSLFQSDLDAAILDCLHTLVSRIMIIMF